MAKPVLLVTRKLPETIETRAARDYDTHPNPQDALWARLGAEIARRAREACAAGILGAPGDRFDAACVSLLTLVLGRQRQCAAAQREDHRHFQRRLRSYRHRRRQGARHRGHEHAGGALLCYG